MTNIAPDAGNPPNNADFYRHHTLAELLADAVLREAPGLAVISEL